MTSCYTGPKPFKLKCPRQNGRMCLPCRKQLLGFNLHDLEMMKVVEVNLYGVTEMSP